MDQPTRVFLGVCFAVVGCLGSSLAIADGGDRVWNEVYERSDAAALDERFPTTSEGWARWSIDGTFDFVVAVPDDERFLTVAGPSDRLALVNPSTGEVQWGPELASVVDVVVSADGGIAYVASGANVGSATRLERFSLPEMISLGEVDIEASVPNAGLIADVAPIPGGTDRVMVATLDALLILDAGTVGNDVLRGNDLPRRVVGADAALAYGVRDGQLWTIEISAAGVTSLEAKARVPYDRDPYIGFRGTVIVGTVAAGPTDFSPQTATVLEASRLDPTLGLRYIHTRPFSDPDIGENGNRSVIFDDVTGATLFEEETWCLPGDRIPVLLGDGLVATFPNGPGDSIDIDHVPDRCGVYGEFTPIEPARVFDSRSGQGQADGPAPLVGGDETRVAIHGLVGVPEDGVESVVLNVTAVNQRGVGEGKNYLTVWPAGFGRPTVSNINVGDGETVGNMVTVSTAAGGFVDVYSNAGTVDVTVDVMGYFSSALGNSGARFWPVDNNRLLDTRGSERLAAGERLEIDVNGRLSFDPNWTDDNIVAVAVNVTAIQPTDKGHFRIFPSGEDLPDASAMNFSRGLNTNRLVTVKTTQGRFEVWNAIGSTNVTVDIVGVYVEDSLEAFNQAGRFVGIVPFRDLDTRQDSPYDGSGAIPPGSSIIFPGYRRGITLVANLTAVRPTTTGYLSTGPWPDDLSGPLNLAQTSSLNFSGAAIVGNQTFATVDREGGGLGVYNSAGFTHVTMDIFGFYT